MSQKINYKIINFDKPSEENSAAKIDIQDQNFRFTILPDFAATIFALENGKILFFDQDGNLQSQTSYSQGFINIADNQCVINIL